MAESPPEKPAVSGKPLAGRAPARAALSPVWVPAGLSLVLALYLIHAAQFLPYVNDDAYITFRHSYNFLAGHGPYYNPGEPVEGYTNFLLMLLTTAALMVLKASSVPFFAKALSVLCGLACIPLTYLLGRSLMATNPGADSLCGLTGVLAAGFLAASPAFAVQSTSGLETTLFAALLIGGLVLALREEKRGRWMGSGLLFGLAVLTRPEGIAVFLATQAGLYAAWVMSPRALVRGKRFLPSFHLALNVGLVGLIFAAHMAWRWSTYGGELLPNTYYAKAGGMSAVESPLRYIELGAAYPFLGVAGLVAAVVGLGFLGKAPLTTAPVLGTLGAAVPGTLLPLVTGTDWMPGWRLVVPFLPFLTVLVAVGWTMLAMQLIRWKRIKAAPFLLLLIPLLYLWQEPARAEFREEIVIRSKGYRNGHGALADWLKKNSQRGETVALMDIGIVGYRNPQLRVLDITGLTDPTIAHSPGGFLNKQYDPAYVLDQEPEYIVLVFFAEGDPTIDPDTTLDFDTWTPMERVLLDQSDFKHFYAYRRDIPEGASWDEAIAARVGASRVFKHAHPEGHYLLALFVRGGERWAPPDPVEPNPNN